MAVAIDHCEDATGVKPLIPEFHVYTNCLDLCGCKKLLDRYTYNCISYTSESAGRF